MKGQLYLCATPIGNLEDITFRVLRVLKEADLIAAEDTRNSIRLLNHFDIHTPMTSYHEYNRIEKGHRLVSLLLEGKNIALITDAGTPGISDPGEDLVRMCRDAGVPVTSLPGACACVTALTISGLPTRRFCFEAFLPSDKKERQKVLEELKTSIAYEQATDEERDYAAAFAALPKISWVGHCMYCGHCAPCPVGIDVAGVTKFLNLARAQGELPETVREHYAVLPHHGGECISCGVCEKRCPFGVPVMENMRRAAEVFGN